jgi:DNA-binding MurR/RpiR family transcriptional regulator
MATNGKPSNGDPRQLTQRLNARRRELIRPVLEEPRPYVLLSLRGMARKLDSDPATLLRTVQAMGFKRYHDFQQYLHDRSIAFSTSLDAWLGHESAAGTAGLIGASIDRDIQNLQQLRSGLDAERLITLARRFYHARRILILAGDVVSCVAQYLQYNLAMLGLNAMGVYMPGEIVHRVRHLTSEDVALAITYGRGLRQTVEGLKQAQKNGAFCVGISDNFISPLQGFSDLFFVTSTDRVSFADSYVGGMAFCNALLVACANVERRRTVALLKKVAAEQREGYRWYPEQR